MRRLLAALVFVAGPALADPLPSYDALVRQFEATAFSAEYYDVSSKGRGVQKWDAPPSYATKGGSQFAAEAIARIAEVLHQPIVRVTAGPTITIHYMPRRRFPAWARANGCAVTRDAAGADIVVGTEPGDVLGGPEHCILEELYQAMGFMNDACHFRPSIVCDDDTLTELAEGDKLLLRALYDPRLRRDMPPAEAMPIARQIIRELVDGWGR